ncbi:alpha/beta hydrolase [Thauera linaloolentis]|uniref:Alpha/beta hydrolase n=1 Tax=Thauera linaloolentis (strain DSM 12138 / JCM 21573 / CCUG 41526 / CIP 105981 / IAM 15112 / NBRC 102519 / 47Lol) TaxID=1123367 RepID=N6YNW2_THAL4|nr:alpha/beta fold hydrolase [Thauera linaloolentis]ENO83858.1 alpha/beta hydrolase [Thauera linaloolentis 47Lol = DSM 12138]MCM8566802.1 alpha/beta hydrolase [Thauera linaloolentis]
MNTSRFGELEVLCHSPSGTARPTPLLFVHGAYVSAWCWEEHFLPWFAARGWASYAVSLSGHGHSRQREHLDTYSIDDYVRDVAEVVAKLPAPPVLIGHSMGGMVVQKYLEQHDAPAAVLMSSVPPQGLMSSAVGLMLQRPTLMSDLNRIMAGNDVDISSLREALFHQPVDSADLQRYYSLSQPESHRAIWDMTLFNLPNPGRVRQVPMLVLGAEHDTLIPAEQVRTTAATYGRRAEIFPGMGHGLMLERDWKQVAERIAAWLEGQQH